MFRTHQATVECATIGGATAMLCDDCAAKIGTGPATPVRDLAHAHPLLSADEAAAYLTGAAGWTFAKSAPDQPHEYLLLSRSADPLAHLRAVRFIRHYGDRRAWPVPGGRGKVWCSYWTPEGSDVEYWTQPRTLEQILNRGAVGR
jgi:hypothetical protein